MIKYVSVIAKFNEFGEITPLSLFWENTQEFTIDKVLSKKNLASTKGGGVGLRFEVKIKNQTRYLFLHEYKWFVEYD